jgi:hypothetical protein
MTTCSALRIGIAICFLLPFGVAAQNPSVGPAGVTGAEYEVFSAYISQSFVGTIGEDRIGKTISQIVIVNGTESDNDVDDHLDPDDMPPGGSVEAYLRKEAPSLRAVTISNFHRANTKQAHLAPRFHLPLRYQLVSAEKIGSILKDDPSFWTEYYRQYPGAQGHMALSRVGFSPDGAQVLLYVSNWCGGLCASGSYVVMEKRGSVWRVVKEIYMWVS